MGYWGYCVVGRAERPLAGLPAPAGLEGLRRHAGAADGWQVWEWPSADGEIAGAQAPARETGAPALFGYVMDSACVVVEAAAEKRGVGATCPARAATARYPGAGLEGLTLEDCFLPPRDAAERAVVWAAEAGRAVPTEPLYDVLTADPDPLAENLFFHLLDRLGVVPL